MAVRSTVVTVTTTPTLVAPGFDSSIPGYRDLAIQNTSQSVVYLGGANVSPTNGFPLKADATLTMNEVPGAQIYATVASSTAAIAVLEVGV